MSNITSLNLGSDDKVDFDFALDVSIPSSGSLISRLKRSVGIEMSSEIISLSLEDVEPFFNKSEIDALLKLQNLKLLEVKEVPNWDLMFFPTKRVKKPVR